MIPLYLNVGFYIRVGANSALLNDLDFNSGTFQYYLLKILVDAMYHAEKTLPAIFRCGLMMDPAAASNPIVTTIKDVSGLLIYFGWPRYS